MPKSFTFTWTIENYSKLALKTDECIQSSAFEIDQGKQVWKLEFNPGGTSKTPDFVVCSLRKSGGTGEMTVNCRFALLNPDKKVFVAQNMKSPIFKKDVRWGLAMTSIENLTSEMKKWTTDTLTIQCAMSVDKSDPLADLKTKSIISLNKVTFVWCIKEPDSPDWSQRKVFSCSENTQIEIILAMDKVDDTIIMEAKNISKDVIENKIITIKISVIDVNNFVQFSEENSYNFFGTTNSLISPFFLNKTFLKEFYCFENGFFTLIFEFSIPNGIVTREFNGSIEYDINPQIKSKESVDVFPILQNDLEQMLLDKKHSDVRIKADNRMFCAHKCILSSRSPVFRAMFDCEMLENNTNVVEINDLDSVTTESFLKFLYSGIIDAADCEHILDLMVAAEKYQVESLTHKCANILMNLLSLDNVFDIFALADLVKHDKLKIYAFGFIETHVDYILESTRWSEWSTQNVRLAFEITSKLITKTRKKDSS